MNAAAAQAGEVSGRYNTSTDNSGTRSCLHIYRRERGRACQIARRRQAAPALAWTVRALRVRARSRLRRRGARRGCVSLAQQPPVTDSRLFQSGIEITSITATVTDRDGHLVTGLEREAFEVYRGRRRARRSRSSRASACRSASACCSTSATACSASGSDDARAAVDRFLFELLDPADEFFLMAFNHQPRAADRLDAGAGRRAARARRACGRRRHRDLRRRSSRRCRCIEKRTRQRAALLVDLGRRRHGQHGDAARAAARRCCAATRSSTRSRSTRPIASRSTRASTRRRCARSPPRAAAAPRSCRTRRSSTRRRRGSPRS